MFVIIHLLFGRGIREFENNDIDIYLEIFSYSYIYNHKLQKGEASETNT